MNSPTLYKGNGKFGHKEHNLDKLKDKFIENVTNSEIDIWN